MADPNRLLAGLQPHRVNEEFPELQQLQPLPLTELARRLCHLFAKGAREPPEADLGGREPVTGELLGELAGYLYLADQSYEGATEAQLSRRLQRKGAGSGFMDLGWGAAGPAGGVPVPGGPELRGRHGGAAVAAPAAQGCEISVQGFGP